jgi:diketogulonate reductase-like aldo/keto reductase
MDRRRFLAIGAGGIGLLAGAPAAAATGLNSRLLTKAIPSSGEHIPAVGMGTWITFNVGSDSVAREGRAEVLEAFFARGGGMIDSSPMYGSAEAVVGHCLQQLGATPGLFSATKIWTSSGDDGPAEIEASRRLWGVDGFDLLQVHNLLGWRDHLPLLLDMKAQGRVRYVGITTSHGRRHGDVERLMRDWPLDFVQLTYNIVDREAEQRLLPLAAERGIAVIANRPYRRGRLIDAVKGHPLPAWAPECGCSDWASFLLKFIVSHPAVTCAIPATSRVDHMIENMGALQGRLPDPAQRQRMIEYVRAL